MADISIKELIEEMVQSDPHKIILSGGRGEYRKVVFERKIIGGKRCFKIERYTEKQVFHQNIDEDELGESLDFIYLFQELLLLKTQKMQMKLLKWFL